jgi:glycosyltransferase involved in cell wall biosynthesis
MKKALFIAYYYPPLGGIGSQRSQKFARYLLDYGWKATVLTPANGSYLFDPSLEDGSDRGIEVVRTRTVELSSILKRAMLKGGAQSAALQPAPALAASTLAAPSALIDSNPFVSFARRAARTWAYIPDAQIGWLPYAVRAGRQILKSQNVDAIYSTSFPVTSHLIAYRLKLRTNKPWVADFRDLWTELHYQDYSSPLRKRVDRFIESRLLEKADALVTVSEGLAETLRKLTGGRKRVEVIRNGFDSEDFSGLEYSRPAKWTLTYVGSFYGANQDPTPLLEALRRAIEGGKIARQDVQLNIVGEPDPYAQKLIARFGFGDITCFTGFVSHREALSFQARSSELLLILHGDKANPGVITGKIFEYLGSRRPIFAIVPPDFEAARIIRETGSGITVDPKNVEGIERHLTASYLEYKSGSAVRSNEADLSAYERRCGARQLAELMADLAGEKKRL